MMHWLNRQPWVRTSERRLLVAHRSIALTIKSVKRAFISKGRMMKTFDYINNLHDAGDFVGIQRLVRTLQEEMPKPWVPHYYKYNELLAYCYFLQDVRTADANRRMGLLDDLRGMLNMDHELGDSIYRAAVELLVGE